MFAVFAVVQRLHEMLVLLDQASALAPAPDLTRLRERVSGRTAGRPEEILDIELDRLAALVGEALREVSRSVRGDGPSYAGHDLAGQDLRDTRPRAGRPARRAADRRRPARRRTGPHRPARRRPAGHRPVRRRPLDRAVPHPAPAQLGAGERGHPAAAPPAPAHRLAGGIVPDVVATGPACRWSDRQGLSGPPAARGAASTARRQGRRTCPPPPAAPRGCRARQRARGRGRRSGRRR